MSTVLTRGRRRHGRRDADGGRQASLFSQVVQPLPREAQTPPEADLPHHEHGERSADRAATATATVIGPTLDEAIGALWDGLLAGESAACPVCREPMQPRHSAAAGVVGGRCTSCASTLA
jgi:hypothetical protein